VGDQQWDRRHQRVSFGRNKGNIPDHHLPLECQKAHYKWRASVADRRSDWRAALAPNCLSRWVFREQLPLGRSIGPAECAACSGVFEVLIIFISRSFWETDERLRVLLRAPPSGSGSGTSEYNPTPADRVCVCESVSSDSLSTHGPTAAGMRVCACVRSTGSSVCARLCVCVFGACSAHENTSEKFPTLSRKARRSHSAKVRFIRVTHTHAALRAAGHQAAARKAARTRNDTRTPRDAPANHLALAPFAFQFLCRQQHATRIIPFYSLLIIIAFSLPATGSSLGTLGNKCSHLATV
jgi:hypothetical protein